MYALYQKITNGYYRRIAVYSDKQEAESWARLIPYAHVEKVKP
jgi:hypothetical protein